MINWLIFGLLGTVALSLIACLILFFTLLRRIRTLELKPDRQPPVPAPADDGETFASTLLDVQREEARKLFAEGADAAEVSRQTRLLAPESHLLLRVFEATGKAP